MVWTPCRSSSNSFILTNTLFSSFYRSFSASAVSITFTVRLRLTKLAVPKPHIQIYLGLTWPSGNFTVDAMPALSEVVLDAFQSVESRHFLWPLVRARLSASIVRRVLVLDCIARGLPRSLLSSSGIGSLASQILFALSP